MSRIELFYEIYENCEISQTCKESGIRKSPERLNQNFKCYKNY